MKLSFEEWLVREGKIIELDLENVLKCRKSKEGGIVEVLIKQGVMEEIEILKLMSHYTRIPIINLAHHPIDVKAALQLPEHLCRKYSAIPIKRQYGKLVIAISNPQNIELLENIKFAVGQAIDLRLAPKKIIHEKINEVFLGTQTTKLVGKVSTQARRGSETPKVEPQSKSYINQFVNNILQRAVDENVSDIHIQPMATGGLIKYRKDGVLEKPTEIDSKEAFEQLVACIKAMATLNITEKRLPQDGRLLASFEEKELDFRISTLPSIYGEKIVIRCIYRKGNELTLEKLQFNQKSWMLVQKMLRIPQGLILVTGPTGCGKSTTLSAFIRALNDGKRNIVTVEEPVESIIEGVNQIAINEEIGLDFARTLRAILRQDPDVIMVGEIRDEQTASTAVRAATTGHIVLSTLHTNDSVGAVVRLLDMGVPKYMIDAALKGVIAQRLVRKICPHCKQLHRVTSQEAFYYGIEEGECVYIAKGCNACKQTGSIGRKAVYEVLAIDDRIRRILGNGQVVQDQIVLEMEKRKINTLYDEVKREVKLGNISLEEMNKVMESLERGRGYDRV